MTKKIILLFILLCFITQLFGQAKKKYSEMSEKERIDFEYAYSEGIRYKITGDIQKAVDYFGACMNIYSESPAVQYELADIFYNNNDLDKALYLAREAVSGNDNNIWYKILLANIYQKKSMIEEACNTYKMVSSTDPDEEKYYLMEAALYTSVEKWDKSLDVYDRYEKHFGISEPLIFEKIKLCLQLKDIKRATSELMKLINKYPDNDNYKLILSDMYFDGGDEKKGFQVLNKLLKSKKDGGYVNFNMASYYAQKGNYQKADAYMRAGFESDNVEINNKIQYIYRIVSGKDSLQKNADDYIQIVLKKHSDNVLVRSFYADYLKSNGDYVGAKKEMEYVLSKEKNDYGLWEDMLLLLNQQLDTTAMLKYANEAIVYFPDQPLPYTIGGVAELVNKNYRGAISYLERALKIGDIVPQLKVNIYSFLGDSYHELDSIEKAFQMYDSVLMIDPQNVGVLNNYAYYLSIRKEGLSKAEDMASRAVSKEPDNATYLDTYAWVLFVRHNYSTALYYMRRAIENMKTPSGVYYEHYGDILYMNGEKDKALEMWKKAAELGDEISNDLQSKINGKYNFE